MSLCVWRHGTQQTHVLPPWHRSWCISFVCTYVSVCVLCSGPDLPSGFPGVCGHRRPVHCPDAAGRFLPGVLPLLWQLWREDVPEADVLHWLSQKNLLLECIHHYSHYPVSVCVCVCVCVCVSEQHDVVLSEISIVERTAWAGSPRRLCASPLGLTLCLETQI